MENNTEGNQQQEEQQPVESERTRDFLFGIVQEMQSNDEDRNFSAKLDLPASFNGSSFDQPNPVKEFVFKEGVTEVYELSGGDISEESKKEAAFSYIEEGDELAIRCTVPPQTTEELMNYNKFTALEILIIKKENE